MSRIVALETRPIAGDTGILLCLGDDAGRVGWGEAVVRAGFCGPLGALVADAAGLAGRLGGRALADGDDLAGIADIAEAVADLASPLRFAVETALLDLAGQRAGAPIAALLGDAGPGAPSIARTAFLEDHGDLDRFQGTGFIAAKVKARGPWPAALPPLLALADAAARAGVGLRVDCNGSMPGAAAGELLAALAAAGVAYVEEPCAGLDVAGWRALAAAGAALAVDESALAAGAFAGHLEAGAAAVVILKPAFVGGLLEARRRALQARERGLRVVITSALEGAIGAAAAAHLALAIGCDEPCGITLRRGSRAPEWLAPQSARIRAPERPGLGVGGPA